jgi:plasmid stabilization system protein ParE
MSDATVTKSSDPHFDALGRMLRKMGTVCHVISMPHGLAGVEAVAVYSKMLPIGQWVIEEEANVGPEWAQGAKRRLAVNINRMGRPKGMYQNLRRALGLERRRANTGSYPAVRRHAVGSDSGSFVKNPGCF